MERKIGEIFEHNGDWYQVVECSEDNYPCIGCCGCKGVGGARINGGECYGDARNDRKFVIFKKLEKVGEPYGHYEKLYQCYKLPMETEIRLLPDNCHPIGKDNLVEIEIRENKENNMEGKNNNQTEDTPLKRLVSEYINNKIEYSDFEKRVKMLYVDDEGEELKLIPFDLSKAKSGRKIYTRDGKMARIVDFESKGTRPIVALVTEDEEEVPYKYNIDGSYNCSQIQSDYDLFMALKKVEGWININAGIIPYETREEAEKHAKREHRQIKVSWEY